MQMMSRRVPPTCRSENILFDILSLIDLSERGARCASLSSFEGVLSGDH